jgi:hypothetical protein
MVSTNLTKYVLIYLYFVILGYLKAVERRLFYYLQSIAMKTIICLIILLCSSQSDCA